MLRKTIILKEIRALRVVWVLGLAIAFAAMIIEIAIRLSGLVSFPIYDVGQPTKFIVSPNQSGRFADRNDWYFNNKSMPIQRDWSVVHPNVLLIGNSIIMGGNPFQQAQKLTSQIQRRLGSSPIVWPVATGGWSQPNEVAYLYQHPEIVRTTDYVSWEYMAGGLNQATPWAGQYVFPSHRPLYATVYIIKRYFMPAAFGTRNGSELPISGNPSENEILKFDDMTSKLLKSTHCAPFGFIWLYPTKAQLALAQRGLEWLPERSQVLGIAKANGLSVMDLAMNARWNGTYYRPDGVHPTVEGTAVLAAILTKKISADVPLHRKCLK